MLTKQHIDIVKSTSVIIEQGGSAITEHFYNRMFRENPELKHIFNMSNQHTGRLPHLAWQAVQNWTARKDFRASSSLNCYPVRPAPNRYPHSHSTAAVPHYQRHDEGLLRSPPWLTVCLTASFALSPPKAEILIYLCADVFDHWHFAKP